MRPYIHKDFLLSTPAARELYHRFWGRPAHFRFSLPFVPPGRSGRTSGSRPSPRCGSRGTTTSGGSCGQTGCRRSSSPGTGDPYEKFLAWARTVEKSVGNPLYAWDPHGIEKLLRGGGAPQQEDRPRHLAGLQRKAARAWLLRPGAHPAEQCKGPVHHRRPGGHLRAPRRHRRRRQASRFRCSPPSGRRPPCTRSRQTSGTG